MTTLLLPDWQGVAPDSPIAARRNISGAAAARRVARPSEIRQATVAAAGAPIRLLYGHDTVGADIFAVATLGSDLLVGCLWGYGTITSIAPATINSEAPPASVSWTHYLGTPTQTPDPWLAAAIAGYADALTISSGGETIGLAYSVARIPRGAITGFPRITAEIYGLAIYDPRTDEAAYSENAALQLLDVMGSAVYGLGRTVDWTGSLDAINAQDELVDATEARRTASIAIDSLSSPDDWVETMRLYCSVYVARGADGWRLVPDRPATSMASLTSTDVVGGSLRIRKKSKHARPTVVRVTYTDTSVTPWRDAPAVAYAAGVVDGTVPWRESHVPMPGVHRYSQAYREAVERLNRATLCDVEVEFDAFDEAIQYEVGDLIDLTHHVGLSAKTLRITDLRRIAPGRRHVVADEYDVAVYSDSIASAGTTPDTGMPSPLDIPTPTGLTAEEEVYQMQTGIYASRIRASWSADDYPYPHQFEWRVLDDSTLIWTGTTTGNEITTPALAEDVTYTVDVRIAGISGIAGDWATDTLTAAGKYLPPGDVPNISAFEVGGRVYLSWEPAADIDIWRYRLKYGAVGGDYSTAITLDLIDGLRYQTADIPAGTWVVYVVAVDSVRNESETPASVTVTVTLDNGAYFVADYTHTAPVASGLAEYSIGPHDAARYWVTDDGRSAATKFPATASTYTEIAATYHDGSASDWHGESEDFGLTLSGTWSGSGSAQALTGTARTRIQTSSDASVWNTGASTAVLATARFARLQHASDSGVIKVALSEAAAHSVRLDAIPRSFELSDTSSASAPVTLTLDTPVAKYISVTVQPLGATPLIGVADNLVTGDPSSLDVYVFDAGGTQVAADFICTIRGVG